MEFFQVKRYPGYWNFVVAAAGILIICLIPFICPKNLSLVSSNDFKSTDFQNVGILLLFSTFPVILDIILDISTEKQSESIFHELLGRTYYITLSFIFASHLYLQKDCIYFYDSYDTNMWVLLWCYRIAFMSTIMFILSVSNPDVFSVRLTLFFNVFACFTGFVQLYTDLVEHTYSTAMISQFFIHL